MNETLKNKLKSLIKIIKRKSSLVNKCMQSGAINVLTDKQKEYILRWIDLGKSVHVMISTGEIRNSVYTLDELIFHEWSGILLDGRKSKEYSDLDLLTSLRGIFTQLLNN